MRSNGVTRKMKERENYRINIKAGAAASVYVNKKEIENILYH